MQNYLLIYFLAAFKVDSFFFLKQDFSVLFWLLLCRPGWVQTQRSACTLPHPLKACTTTAQLRWILWFPFTDLETGIMFLLGYLAEKGQSYNSKMTVWLSSTKLFNFVGGTFYVLMMDEFQVLPNYLSHLRDSFS